MMTMRTMEAKPISREVNEGLSIVFIVGLHFFPYDLISGVSIQGPGSGDLTGRLVRDMLRAARMFVFSAELLPVDS